MKKLFFVALILVTCYSNVFAQQYTRIGVVDLTKIYSQFYKDSAAVRELEEMKIQFDKEILTIRNEIKELNDKKLEFQKNGDNIQALDYDNRAFKRQEYLNEFIRIKQAQLFSRRDAITKDNTFQIQIMKVISDVAVKNGFAIVMRMDNASLLHYSEESDITELVLRELAR